MENIFTNDKVKQIIITVLLILTAISLLTGVSAAWFYYQYSLKTVGKIHPLTYISILAPGETEIQSIDLSYDKSEVKNGRVEIKRPFVIRSEEPNFDLCIAHTTNISGLTISLFEATEGGSEGNAYIAGITEKGTPYYWNKQDPNLFHKDGYINADPNASTAITADKTHPAHNETFRQTEESIYGNVQKNAEPLYWVKQGITGQKRAPNDGYYYCHYILEITWDETDKETDILYVIAQNSQPVSEGNN